MSRLALNVSVWQRDDDVVFNLTDRKRLQTKVAAGRRATREQIERKTMRGTSQHVSFDTPCK